MPTPRERLISKVETQADGCWQWTGCTSANGYARMHYGPTNGSEYAHRVSFRIFVGEIPEGREIDHLCRNRSCVNPNHLEAVTRTENVRRGDATKLTAADVREIRASTETTVALGKRFGVAPGYISRLKHGHWWREVTLNKTNRDLAGMS